MKDGGLEASMTDEERKEWRKKYKAAALTGLLASGSDTVYACVEAARIADRVLAEDEEHNG